jgi:hypothetical protein
MPETSKLSLKPFFIALFLGMALFAGYFIVRDTFGGGNINSFDDCVKAGNPVQESYPSTCTAGDQTFVDTAQITQ